MLESDKRLLDQLGLDAETLSSHLRQLLQAAVTSKKATTRAGTYKIRLRRYKGPQICPFASDPYVTPCPVRGDNLLASIDWTITNQHNGTKLSGPGLIVHLIGEHKFFEGLGSPYRVSPLELAKLLELGPFSGHTG